MNLNNDINKALNNVRFSKKLFQLYRILRNEFNITCFIEFEDSRCIDKILVDFVNTYPDLNRFVFMSNSEMINCDLTEWVILNYGFDEYTNFHLIDTATKLGFTFERINKNKIKLILNTK